MISKLYFLVIFVNIFISCDYTDNRLKIKNASKKRIVVETYMDSVPNFSETNNTEYYLRNIINVGQEVNLIRFGSKNGWPLKIMRSKNAKLNLIVYQVDSLMKYKEIDSLIIKKIYSRYEYTSVELEKVAWKVEVR